MAIGSWLTPSAAKTAKADRMLQRQDFAAAQNQRQTKAAAVFKGGVAQIIGQVQDIIDAGQINGFNRRDI